MLTIHGSRACRLGSHTHLLTPPPGLNCIDGFNEITIDGEPVPSTFEFYLPNTASFTAYDLAGTGLIKQGAQVCVNLFSCCK